MLPLLDGVTRLQKDWEIRFFTRLKNNFELLKYDLKFEQVSNELCQMLLAGGPELRTILRSCVQRGEGGSFTVTFNTSLIIVTWKPPPLEPTLEQADRQT